jgi:hypothetical protein
MHEIRRVHGGEAILIKRILQISLLLVYGKRYRSFSRRPASFAEASIGSGIPLPVLTGRGCGVGLSVVQPE